MPFEWRTFLGPALVAATALIALAVDRTLFAIPDTGPLLVCIVALAGALSGLFSGMITAVVAVAALALFFFFHRTAAGYNVSDLADLSMFAAAAIGMAAFTGLLRKRLTKTLAWERRHHATAEKLSAALDQVDIGIVLLDSDTRAEFINRAFRQYFALSDEKADSKPPFIALMYHGRDTGAYELPEDELSSFIAKRTEMMRVGDSTPINLNLRNGQVLRFSCTALPDGGRMLSYTPVTDLVRHNDDPARADHYRAMRGKQFRSPFSDQRAAE